MAEAVSVPVADPDPNEDTGLPLDPVRLDRFETRGTDFPYVRHTAGTGFTETRVKAQARGTADRKGW